MGSNDHLDLELHDLVEDAADSGELEVDSLGYRVAQQVIARGYDSLTAKQRTAYDAEVVPALRRRAEAVRMQELVHSARDRG